MKRLKSLQGSSLPLTASRFILLIVIFDILIQTMVNGDKGCPKSTECKEHCRSQGKNGKCEKRWYRWKYRWRCKCNPCKGKLVLGACITNIGVKCDDKGENCKPTIGFG